MRIDADIPKSQVAGYANVKPQKPIDHDGGCNRLLCAGLSSPPLARKSNKRSTSLCVCVCVSTQVERPSSPPPTPRHCLKPPQLKLRVGHAQRSINYEADRCQSIKFKRPTDWNRIRPQMKLTVGFISSAGTKKKKAQQTIF